MSIVFDGVKQEVPGVNSICWDDKNSKVKYVTDKTERKRRIRVIVCHTHHGVLSDLVPGVGPNTTIDESLAKYQVSTDRYVSWDYTVDLNGDVTWQNDPAKHYTWQAGDINDISLGFEMVQQTTKTDSKGNPTRANLYEEQIKKSVLMIDFLTAKMGIQRQIPWDKKKDKPVAGTLKRLAEENCVDFVGIVGHRNLTGERGPGDPGDAIFYALRDAGYELVDVSSKEDIEVWKDRQKNLLQMGAAEADGIPLDKTVQALKAKGYKHGMLIKRPIDDLI